MGRDTLKWIKIRWSQGRIVYPDGTVVRTRRTPPDDYHIGNKKLDKYRK